MEAKVLTFLHVNIALYAIYVPLLCCNLFYQIHSSKFVTSEHFHINYSCFVHCIQLQACEGLGLGLGFFLPKFKKLKLEPVESVIIKKPEIFVLFFNRELILYIYSVCFSKKEKSFLLSKTVFEQLLTRLLISICVFYVFILTLINLLIRQFVIGNLSYD
ncbi:hypothetical protein P9112_002949 [Eukaryota sp. TZLM1-RC]